MYLYGFPLLNGYEMIEAFTDGGSHNTLVLTAKVGPLKERSLSRSLYSKGRNARLLSPVSDTPCSFGSTGFVPLGLPEQCI